MVRLDGAGVLERRRLAALMERRWDVRVTLVVAPAGYGKTTAVAQAVAANALAPVGVDYWVPADGNLTVASELASALGGRLGAAVPSDGSPQGVAAAVAAAVWRRAPLEVCLVLDDVHEVGPGSAGAGVLAAVVAALPANGHIVLSGRTPPPVALARLAVSGDVQRVGAADLAFTDAELRAFAAHRRVPAERLAASGGWPAMAELLASGTIAGARAYVVEEVVQPTIAARRRRPGAVPAAGDEHAGTGSRWLHDAALLTHLGPFDAATAQAALARRVDVAELLAGLPLVDETPNGVYRFHDVWRPLVAAAADAACVDAARRRAGRHLRRRGEVPAAIRLFAAAEAWDDVAASVVDALGAARPPVARDVLASWLARLPEAHRETPAGRLLAGVAATEADPEGAWTTLSRAAVDFGAEGEVDGELACLVHLGELAWWSERPDRLGHVARRVFEIEAVGHAGAVPLACIARALLHDIADDSLAVVAELDRIVPGTLGGTWVTVVDALRATALLQLGDSSGALAHLDSAGERATSVHAVLLEAARMHALVASGCIDEAAEALPALAARCRRTGYRHATALVAAHCSLAHSLLGRVDEAAVHLVSARTAGAAAADVPMVTTALTFADAALAVATGDERRAARLLAQESLRTPTCSGLSAAAHRRSVALTYVLVPATRTYWDAADLGPDAAVGRDLARALVAVRDHGKLPADPPIPRPGVVTAHLPLPWRAELAVAATIDDRADAAHLIEDDWPAARPAVTALADGADDRGHAARPAGVRNAARAVLARLPATPHHGLELRLLGPPELWRSGSLVDAAGWRRERVRSLLAHLALCASATREQVADDLWPALDAEAQSRNLRVNLTHLLQVLEPDRAPRHASYFVRQHGAILRLHADHLLRVDVHRFDDACRRADAAERDGRPGDVLAASLDAVALWRGEPTEVAGEAWAVVPIEQRRLRVTGAAVRAGELLLARGDAASGGELADRALALDPWLEGAHRLRVAARRAVGDHAGARRAVAAYREAAHDLGLSPDDAAAMAERLVAGDRNHPPAARRVSG